MNVIDIGSAAWVPSSPIFGKSYDYACFTHTFTCFTHTITTSFAAFPPWLAAAITTCFDTIITSTKVVATCSLTRITTAFFTEATTATSDYRFASFVTTAVLAHTTTAIISDAAAGSYYSITFFFITIEYTQSYQHPYNNYTHSSSDIYCQEVLHRMLSLYGWNMWMHVYNMHYLNWCQKLVRGGLKLQYQYW